MTKFCPECGTHANGGKFCAECGKRFDADPPTTGGGAAPPAPAPIPTATSFQSYNPSAVANAYGANTSTNSFGANANGAAAWNQMQSVVPMATPVVKPAYPSAKAVAVVASDPVPDAATGAEAQQCYEQCVTTMRASRGGANESGVKTFKSNCRLYGLQQMNVTTFYASLVHELGPEATVQFVPGLARLIPDYDRRKELVDHNARQRAMLSNSNANANNNGHGVAMSPHGGATTTNGIQSQQQSGTSAYNGQSLRNSSSSSGSYDDRGRTSSMSSANANANANGGGGLLKGRYANHPNCDICNSAFEVTKRRHQCRLCGLYVCSSCSPLRLLIPPGREVAGSKGYEPSIPQRVCIQCAPQLHGEQEALVARYAKSNEANHHEARGRIHIPFSSSLFKECQNAADIIGNFFRNEWGSSTDRGIPASLLQKAHGLAILTIVKAGFLITGQLGTGLVVAKLPDGSWSAPSAVGIAGLGGGFEIGGEIVELMIILGSPGAVRVLHKPQVSLGAGLDLTVGPYGRSAMAAASASASGLNANYSYSQSKGLYAGISLQGAVMAARGDLNRKFYGRDVPPSDILTGIVPSPPAAQPLYDAIQNALDGVEAHRESMVQRSSLMGPCRLCNCPTFVAHTHQIWNKNCKTCKHVH